MLKSQLSANAGESGIISEAALLKLIPVSARTLRNWRNNGAIPHIQLPGARRVLYHAPSVLEALVRRQKGGSKR